MATVYSYTVVYRAPTRLMAESTPYVVALIDLDEGPRMLSNVVGSSPEDVFIGMRVRVDFDEADGFKVPVFRPA